MRADRLVLVDRIRKTAEVVEQEKNPVTPDFERVQPVLEAWKRLNLPEKLEVGPSYTVCVLWDDFDDYRPKQVGPEGHDVTARVKSLGVRVQEDGGRVVRGEDMDECVFQTRLVVVHLILETSDHPRGVIDGYATEDVVQDQRPAGSTFVILPQPGRELVEIQQPVRLLIPCEGLVVQFGEKFGIVHSHFGTSVPEVGAGRTKQRRKNVSTLHGPWGAVESRVSARMHLFPLRLSAAAHIASRIYPRSRGELERQPFLFAPQVGPARPHRRVPPHTKVDDRTNPFARAILVAKSLESLLRLSLVYCNTKDNPLQTSGFPIKFEGASNLVPETLKRP